MLNPDLNSYYIGLVSAGDTAQEPQKLVNARGGFWSNDGTGIFYHDHYWRWFRFDTTTNQSKPLSFEGRFLGKVPGADAVFVRADTTVTISNIASGANAAKASSSLLYALANIPVQDTEQRPLWGVQSSNNRHRLLLVYLGPPGGHAGAPAPWGDNDQHVQVLSVQ